MTPASALAALSPERRAAVIYGAAQAELSDRLWKAALGPEASDTSARGGTTADFRDHDSQLTALMNLLSLEATRNGIAAPSPAPPPAQLPGEPTHASPIGAASSRMTAVQGDARDAIVDAAPCSFGANARYRDCVDAAAARTGLPAAALAAIVDAEAAKAPDGSWQTYSRNPRLGKIGSSNAAFARRFIETENIAIGHVDVGGSRARKLEFLPYEGKTRSSFVADPVPILAPMPLVDGDVELF